MLKKTKQVKFILVYIILLLLPVTVILFEPELESVYAWNYVTDTLCGALCLFLYFDLVNAGCADLFSSSTFLTALYVTMYFVTPIYDLIRGEILWFGKDLFGYGVKGSLYALAGYFVFYFFTRYDFRFRTKKRSLFREEGVRTEETQPTEFAVFYILAGYCLCLVAYVYYLIASGGNGLLYILSLGLMGSSGFQTTGDIGAVSMLAFSLISFTLLYFEYGKNRFLKVLTFLIMFELQTVRGFRYLIFQIIITFGAYYYIKRDKRPKLSSVILVCGVTLVPILIMTIFRDTIRAGAGMNILSVNKKVITEALDAAFWNNLRIYKNFYALLSVIPEKTPFLFGAQTVKYTLIMLIPRAVWGAKPGNPGTLAQEISLGTVAVKSGSAYPALGEFFYDFGLAGIIFWMGVYAVFLKRIENKYRFCRRTAPDLMIHCTVLGSVLQFSIRGYMPSNVWMLVFCLLPFLIMKRFFLKRTEI